MKQRRDWCLLFAGFFFLSGCFDTQPQSQRMAAVPEAFPPVVCSSFAEVQAHHVVVLLFDRSGSVHDHAQARMNRFREDAVNAIHHVPPATLIFARYIAENSYSDTEQILAEAIPDVPPPFTCTAGPFDYKKKRQCKLAKQRYEAQLQCVATARQRIASSIQALAPQRAHSTDIFGAIAVAEETFRAYPNAQRSLLVYSDLEDTVRTQLPTVLAGLQGVEVIVRTARTDNPKKAADRFEAFSGRLSPVGAQVSSRGLETPLTWFVASHS